MRANLLWTMGVLPLLFVEQWCWGGDRPSDPVGYKPREIRQLATLVLS